MGSDNYSIHSRQIYCAINMTYWLSGKNFPISCISSDGFIFGFVAGYLAAYFDNIHRARSPRSVSIWPYRCFPRRRSVSQVGISIHTSRPGGVTAPGVTAAEMYGNCTRLTYRLGVARGLQVPSRSITDSTSTCRYQKGTRKKTRPS